MEVPADDARALLNDLDLRFAVEQKVELRHAETATLAGAAVAAALVGKLFDAGASVIPPALYAAGVLLMVVGVTSERRARLAERRLAAFCARFSGRNGIAPAEILAIVDLAPGPPRMERTILPTLSF